MWAVVRQIVDLLEQIHAEEVLLDEHAFRPRLDPDGNAHLARQPLAVEPLVDEPADRERRDAEPRPLASDALARTIA